MRNESRRLLCPYVDEAKTQHNSIDPSLKQNEQGDGRHNIC
jgi:hypothetical protein